MTLEELGLRFKKQYSNRYIVKDSCGNIIPYRHPDLYEFAEKAYSKGEDFFYANPADPKIPNGKQVLAEPEYDFVLYKNLTEEEFTSLFGEYDEGKHLAALVKSLIDDTKEIKEK